MRSGKNGSWKKKMYQLRFIWFHLISLHVPIMVFMKTAGWGQFITTSLAQRSSRVLARCHASPPPQSCPTMIALGACRWSRRATTSSRSVSMSYGPFALLDVVHPQPVELRILVLHVELGDHKGHDVPRSASTRFARSAPLRRTYLARHAEGSGQPLLSSTPPGSARYLLTRDSWSRRRRGVRRARRRGAWPSGSSP